MPGDLDFAKTAASLAAQRAAEVLIRTLGASAVHVRAPLATVPNGNAGQLGMAGAATEDVLLAPVAIRELRNRRRPNAARFEVLLAPATLAKAKELRTAESVREFFHGAIGIVLRGKLMRIESVAADGFAGSAYLYRLVVAE